MTGDGRDESQSTVEKQILNTPVTNEETFTSPTGRYRFDLSERWATNSSFGTLSNADGSLITTVERNYSDFPYTWAESHLNGHDYFICGEDYQGQTIVELDTGKRIDHLPDEKQPDGGFCWAAHYVSKDRRFLAVDGCFWACPYELVIFDFNDPMSLPYPELGRFDEAEVLDGGFLPDDSLTWISRETIRKSDGKLLEALNADEADALRNESGRFRIELLDKLATKRIWRAGRPVEAEVVPPALP